MTNVYAHFLRTSKSLVALMLAVPVLVLAGRATAQEHGPPTALPVATTGMSATQTSTVKGFAPVADPVRQLSHASGPQEGVKVHGHWVIDVKNPDGTLAQHREFENSLTNANVMVSLLYGNEVPADFVVLLGGSTPPCAPGTSTYPCVIVHNLSSFPASAICGTFYCVTGLTVTPTLGQNPALVLAGSLTATQAGSISSVSTEIGLCGSPSSTQTTTSPSSCAAGNNGYGYSGLTGTGITAVPIINGQIIQVTVTITFS